MGTHLTEWGIHIQQTATYSHQQNGKVERFVQTIEDGAWTLVVRSDLPPSCCSDGWIPTSMSPHHNSTQKPDPI